MATRAPEVNTIVPGLSAERPVTWPKRARAKLSNGLEVILAESHTIPKFHGELFFRSGNAAAIDRGPGLAEMTASVLRTGTAKRASRQIEEDLRRIGADLAASAGADNSAISFAGLSELAEPLLGLVNELAREAVFPEAEFERERRQKLEEVWTGKMPERKSAAAPAQPRGRRVHLVHVPGAVQTQVLAGCHAITRKHPDWVKLGLTNSLYGGAFNSRLVMNIREDKGYTYSPRSSVNAFRQHGYFSVSAAVRNDVVAASLTEIFYELEKLRSLPVPDAELADAQNYLSGVFSLGLATQSGLLSQFATVALNELPEDYLETYRAKVRALRPADVLETARKYFDSANMQIVVVGDRSQIESQAALFGELEVYDAQGKRL